VVVQDMTYMMKVQGRMRSRLVSRSTTSSSSTAWASPSSAPCFWWPRAEV